MLITVGIKLAHPRGFIQTFKIDDYAQTGGKVTFIGHENHTPVSEHESAAREI